VNQVFNILTACNINIGLAGVFPMHVLSLNIIMTNKTISSTSITSELIEITQVKKSSPAASNTFEKRFSAKEKAASAFARLFLLQAAPG